MLSWVSSSIIDTVPSGNDPADLEDSPNRSSGGHDAQGNQAEHQRHVSKPAGGFWFRGAIEHFGLVDC
jgi:hypothetical protein